MNDEGPKRLEFNAVLEPTIELEAVLRVVVERLAKLPGFEPNRWSLVREVEQAESFAQAGRLGRPTMRDVETLGADAFAQGFIIDGESLSLTLSDLRSLQEDPYSVNYGRRSGFRLSGTDSHFRRHGFQAYFSALHTQLAILRMCFAELPVYKGHIKRDDGIIATPHPPHAHGSWTAVLAKVSEIDRDYANPDAYWSGWDEVEYLGAGHALVTRGTKLYESTAFVADALDSGYAIARGARGGLTDHPIPRLGRHRDLILSKHPKFLRCVGYGEGRTTLDFLADLPPDTHLGPADFVELMSQTPGSTAEEPGLQRLRVTFVDEQMAAREAPILRDLGVIVQFYGDDGALVELAPTAGDYAGA